VLGPVIGLCVLLPVSFRVDRAPGGAELAVTALAILVAVVAITVVPRAGIKVDDDGVTVRNSVGASKQVPWQQVIRFEAREASGPQGRNGGKPSHVRVICSDREPIDSYGCSARAGALEVAPKITRIAARLEAVRLRQAGKTAGGDTAASG
jgi:hypothetical protein